MSRIAIVSPFTLPHYCGNSMLAERLRSELLKRGHDVELFDSSHDRPEDAQSFSPDIIHSIHVERPADWLERFFLNGHVPWVITLTGTDYNTWRGGNNKALSVKGILEGADALVVFHDDARNYLTACFPHIENSIFVNPQGTPLYDHRKDRKAVRHEYGIVQDQIVFLMVSGIRKVKNIEYALQGFSRIEETIPNALMVLAGPVIDQEVADNVLGIGGGLKGFLYLGELPSAKVRELMHASDVFFNTSFHEGMPGAVMEAMAEGLPVIATNTMGNRNLIVNEENGFLVSLENVEELVQASGNLVPNALLRKTIGSAARDFICRNHDVRQEIDHYERIYQMILAGKNKKIKSSEMKN